MDTYLDLFTKPRADIETDMWREEVINRIVDMSTTIEKSRDIPRETMKKIDDKMVEFQFLQSYNNDSFQKQIKELADAVKKKPEYYKEGLGTLRESIERLQEQVDRVMPEENGASLWENVTSALSYIVSDREDPVGERRAISDAIRSYGDAMQRRQEDAMEELRGIVTTMDKNHESYIRQEVKKQTGLTDMSKKLDTILDTRLTLEDVRNALSEGQQEMREKLEEARAESALSNAQRDAAVQRLETILEKMQMDEEELMRLQTLVDQQRVDMETLSGELYMVSAENEEKNEHIRHLATNSYNQDDIHELEARIAEREAELREAHETINIVTNARDEYILRTSELTDKMDDNEAAIEYLQNTVDSWKEKADDHEAKEELLRAQLKQLEHEKEHARQTHESMEAAMENTYGAEVEQLRRDNEKLQNEYDEDLKLLLSSLDLSEGELEDFKKRLSEMKLQADGDADMQDRLIDDIKKDIIRRPLANDKQYANLEMKLDELASRLETEMRKNLNLSELNTEFDAELEHLKGVMKTKEEVETEKKHLQKQLADARKKLENEKMENTELLTEIEKITRDNDGGKKARQELDVTKQKLQEASKRMDRAEKRVSNMLSAFNETGQLKEPIDVEEYTMALLESRYVDA